MITQPYGDEVLVFDRDAIVRAALYAHIEASFYHVDPRNRLVTTPCVVPYWEGDVRQGTFTNEDGCGSYDVVAWTEAGVVGLAWELGWGPVELLGLAISAVTRSRDDVRGAVPGLPPELEPAFRMAADPLPPGRYGEKLAGVGFWFLGDRIGGSMFEDPTAEGANRLVAWGSLEDGKLPLLYDRETKARWAETNARNGAGPIQALVDALVARALQGPTELTIAEVELLLPTSPGEKRVLAAQRRLQQAGITWPGSPALPPLPPPGPNPFIRT